MSKHRRRRRHLRDGDSLTLKEFMRKHKLPHSSYYDLKRRGLGPREMRLGRRNVRISAAADRDWVARLEAAEAAAVPVFAPKSPARGVKGFEDAKTAHRPHKKRSKERVLVSASRSSGRGDDKHRNNGTSPPRRQKGRSHRDDDKTNPRRQRERSKERGHRNEHRDNDETIRRRKRRRSKERKRRRSKKARSGDVRTQPQLGITELKRRLKTGKRLPKDALIESRRWRLPSNPHRKRDRQIERAMLQALIGPGSSI